ncbi:CLUMA_CG020655, isoform A [Clunio marinus]|uniref:CLUMA_CG020655, isoform A n=1 Tax=Clunio marinus TaxID=568069 RepID=A0A1J1J5K9_9DIPT|nr:CLUMA_CG020655, isoform A [Clunio marinus]
MSYLLNIGHYQATTSFVMTLLKLIILFQLIYLNISTTYLRFSELKCEASPKTISKYYCFLRSYKRSLPSFNVGFTLKRKLNGTKADCRVERRFADGNYNTILNLKKIDLCGAIKSSSSISPYLKEVFDYVKKLNTNTIEICDRSGDFHLTNASFLNMQTLSYFPKSDFRIRDIFYDLKDDNFIKYLTTSFAMTLLKLIIFFQLIYLIISTTYLRFSELKCGASPKTISKYHCFLRSYKRNLPAFNVGFTLKRKLTGTKVDCRVERKVADGNYNTVMNLEKIDVCGLIKGVSSLPFLIEVCDYVKKLNTNTMEVCDRSGDFHLTNGSFTNIKTLSYFPKTDFRDEISIGGKGNFQQ